MWSIAPAAHTRTTPLMANFSASASSTTCSAASIIARLIGTSTIVESQTASRSSTALVPRNSTSALSWRSESSASTPTSER
jgi:hypothetical protein